MGFFKCRGVLGFGAWKTSRSFQNPRFYSTLSNAKRDVEKVDVLIVGAGPSGLSAAIKIKQLASQMNQDFRVCVLEKGAQVGSHILSGAILDPLALDELLDNWRSMDSPIQNEVKKDSMYFLTEKYAFPLPITELQRNHGNYIVSMSQVARWLGNKAEELGVEIYSGFSASEVLYNERGSVIGAATNDQGVGRDGKPKDSFQPGLEIHAPFTLFAEGSRGSLAKRLIEKFDLYRDAQPQTYGLGLKEVWEVKPENFKIGHVVHTMGWPMDFGTWGGSFIYHWEKNMVFLGFVIALDYCNPYISPYMEFQRLKNHPMIRKMLKGGRCISYGARCLNEGGFQSIPRLVFPGGALIGCSAGFLNVPKIKGNHYAMKSGMLAGEAIVNALVKNKSENQILEEYPTMLQNSWIYKDLYRVRNIRPSFSRGTLFGMAYTGMDWLFMRGKEPWTLHHGVVDHLKTKKAENFNRIQYPKPDGIYSFDLLTNLQRSGTNHNEDQPSHLKIVDSFIPTNVNLKHYSGLESRYCPAGVYEFLKDANGNDYLQVNSQNCIHCKTCDIKDPSQNIIWNTPEGGDGPLYSIM